MNKILIADDDQAINVSLAFALEDEYDVRTALDEQAVKAALEKETIDVVLLDQRFGECDGIELLKWIKQTYPDTCVIMMTAYGSIHTSVEAMARGAYYYLTKPVAVDDLLLLLKRATELLSLQQRVESLQEQLAGQTGGIVGKSQAIKEVLGFIDKVKDADANVFVAGESGTGKELIARAIHYTGKRQAQPFIVLNCAAVPEQLMESELFGYVRGAFTGAGQKRRGAFELADKGTLFLDEICEMAYPLQAKLLRVVQEKQLTPLGAEAPRNIDVRIICATNREIETEVREGRFRADLYYRLNVLRIQAPPLRQRREDIPMLAQYFLDKYNRLCGKKVPGFTEAALKALLEYGFPGNVRELENVVERGVILSAGEHIDFNKIVGVEACKEAADCLFGVEVGEPLSKVEKAFILLTLQKMEGNKRKTAEVLGLSERALRYKLQEYKAESEKSAGRQ